MLKALVGDFSRIVKLQTSRVFVSSSCGGAVVLLRSGVLRAGMRWWRDRQLAISRGVAVAVVTCCTHCGYGATGSGSRSWSQRVRDSAMNTWKAVTTAFLWNKYYSQRVRGSSHYCFLFVKKTNNLLRHLVSIANILLKDPFGREICSTEFWHSLE